MNKTFRGLLANEEIEKIRLSTNDGLTGYKINKFQCIGADLFGSVSNEIVCKVFTTENDATGVPRTATATVNFTDPTLAAVSTFSSHDNAHIYPEDSIIIFDSMVFNQDVFITMVNKQGGSGNYYLELEQVKLSKDEATVATLKDMRASE